MDQYRHPHESRHSMAEVERWFERSGIETAAHAFRRPAARISRRTRGCSQRARAAAALDYFASELEMLLTGGRDGGCT